MKRKNPPHLLLPQYRQRSKKNCLFTIRSHHMWFSDESDRRRANSGQTQRGGAPDAPTKHRLAVYRHLPSRVIGSARSSTICFSIVASPPGLNPTWRNRWFPSLPCRMSLERPPHAVPKRPSVPFQHSIIGRPPFRPAPEWCRKSLANPRLQVGCPLASCQSKPPLGPLPILIRR